MQVVSILTSPQRDTSVPFPTQAWAQSWGGEGQEWEGEGRLSWERPRSPSTGPQHSGGVYLWWPVPFTMAGSQNFT